MKKFVICYPIEFEDDTETYFSIPTLYESKEKLEKDLKRLIRKTFKEGQRYLYFNRVPVEVKIEVTDFMYYHSVSGELIDKLDEIEILTVNEWFDKTEEFFGIKKSVVSEFPKCDTETEDYK